MRYGAGTYYRLDQPFNAMELAGQPCFPILDDGSASIPTEKRKLAWAYSDLVVLFSTFGNGSNENMRLMRNWRPGRLTDGTIQHPPTFIVDLDDMMWDVPPTADSFRQFGIKRSNGTLLQPGDNVTISMDGGPHRVLFEDGSKGFNIAENLARLSRYREELLLADAITVTTPYLANYVKQEVDRDAYVLPNCVVFDEFPVVELADHSPKVRILWYGSTSHFEDLWPIQEALRDVVRRHPNIELVLWGSAYSWLVEHIPPEQLRFEPWVPYFEFKGRLACMNHDINLAPLVDKKFSLGRSAIKWYESSSLPKPVCTLAANVGEFEREMTDGTNGLLYNTPDEFAEKLELLIQDAELRQRLAHNAKEWMLENRDAIKWAPKRFAIYQDIREAAKRARPFIETVTEMPTDAKPE